MVAANGGAERAETEAVWNFLREFRNFCYIFGCNRLEPNIMKSITPLAAWFAGACISALPAVATAQQRHFEPRETQRPSASHATVTRSQPSTAVRPAATRPTGTATHDWRGGGGRNGDWCDRNGHWHRDGWRNRWNTTVVLGGFGYPYGYGYYPYGGYGYGYDPYTYGYGGYNSSYYTARTPVYDGQVADGDGDTSVVVQVQRRLARAGLYQGAIDGVIGNGTRRAIRAFERSHGLPVDGRIDSELLATMGLA
jgi:hypothetical protein